MRSGFDAAVLLVADGLVAVGRVLGGLRKGCAAEKHADALAVAEERREVWAPGELEKLWECPDEAGPESPKWVKDAIDAANQYAAETYLHFIPQRSAAVSTPAAANTPEHLEAAYNYHRPQANYNGTLVWGCEGCNWHGSTIQAHSRHRFHVLADMKNATHRIQEQLGGAS